MSVRLISITEDPEHIISYIARVSNPDNQSNPDYTKLIKYLIRHEHYSPFEHAFMTVEIKTSRAIATQLIRHRSFTWQEFSQRYSEVTEFEPIELRRQAEKNRQSSTDVFDPQVGMDNVGWGKASECIDILIKQSKSLYDQLIKAGVAKECARMILPLTTQSTLYMSGTIRSWIHYLALRTKEDTQKEHRVIALEIKSIFDDRLPTVAAALAQIKQENEDKELLYRLLKVGAISLDSLSKDTT